MRRHETYRSEGRKQESATVFYGQAESCAECGRAGGSAFSKGMPQRDGEDMDGQRGSVGWRAGGAGHLASACIVQQIIRRREGRGTG